MSSTELEREAFIKQEICSVATDGIGIEPEDNYTQNNIVYCLTVFKTMIKSDH